jgi:hypothetical protein
MNVNRARLANVREVAKTDGMGDGQTYAAGIRTPMTLRVNKDELS